MDIKKLALDVRQLKSERHGEYVALKVQPKSPLSK